MSTTQTATSAVSTVAPSKTLVELARRAIGIELNDPKIGEIRVTDICSDSRRVEKGSLFIVIAGNKGDGAQYVANAADRGAVAIVSDRDIAVPRGVAHVLVPHARDAASKLAAVFYGLDEIQARGELTVSGVTGTNGKSTIAYMIRAILRAANHPAALFGTIEYDLVSRKLGSALTTPDPIELIKHLVEAHAAGARHAVMEVSSHSLDQYRTSGIRFSAGVFTNLTQDHLDYHGTMEAYSLAKRKLFDSLEPDGTAVINIDDPAADAMIESCKARVIRYAIDAAADIKAESVVATKTGCNFRIVHQNVRYDAMTCLAGRHNVYNALAATGAALSMGIDFPTIVQGLASLSRVPGRLQRVDTGKLGFDVFVDYAHTDDALQNVLTALRPLTTNRLCCVFGCGGDRDRSKRPRMAKAVADFADSIFITSDNPRTEDPLAIIADIESGLTPESRIRSVTVPDRAEAIHMAIYRMRQGDVLLIAGKGHEDYQIIGTEKRHFDDVEVALEAIGRKINN